MRERARRQASAGAWLREAGEACDLRFIPAQVTQTVQRTAASSERTLGTRYSSRSGLASLRVAARVTCTTCTYSSTGARPQTTRLRPLDDSLSCTLVFAPLVSLPLHNE